MQIQEMSRNQRICMEIPKSLILAASQTQLKQRESLIAGRAQERAYVEVNLIFENFEGSVLGCIPSSSNSTRYLYYCIPKS